MVRFKNRYLVCEITPEHENIKISARDIMKSVSSAVSKAYGDYGMGLLLISLSVKYWNVDTRIAIIRARRGAHQMVQAAVTLIKSVGKTNVCFRTLHIGGTIRTCQKFLIKHHQRELRSLLQRCKTEEQRNSVKQSIIASGVNLQRGFRKKEFPKTKPPVVEKDNLPVCSNT